MSDPRSEDASVLRGYVNFRDLGGHRAAGGTVRSGRVFRSDSLAHVEAEHVEHLVNERGIRTVVDLRGAAEVDAYPNHPMREAGATIHHVPLFDPAVRRQDLPFDVEKLTLVDLYQFIINTAGAQFVEALQIIAEPASHPLVFHCAAGKDRAGLVAAMTLGLLGVSDDEIVEDYAATSAALDALYARAHARATNRRQRPADRFMTAEASTMREVLEWFHEAHGGFESYAVDHGLASGAIAVMRAALVEPAG
jgi:protein-tyrosine phosphatase